MKKISKTLTVLTASAFAIIATAASSHAAILITGSAEADPTSQLPGSPTDYYLTGSASDLSNGPVTSVTPIASNDYTDGSTILNPGGTSVSSTDAYENYAPRNYLSFTLGTSLMVDYSNINVYVLYNNTGYPFIDSSLSLSQGSDATGTGSTSVPVDETSNTSGTTGDIVEFNIIGAQGGETFTVAAAGNGTALDDVGGVSFAFGTATTPEPSTLALMFAGLGVLVTVAHRKVSATRL